MLSSIHIRDLAIVSAVELELHPGMTSLTGETGAGKSILIDALGLALGERADNGMIRQGSKRAEITAIFQTGDLPGVQQWLEEESLDDGTECILRRVLVRDGNSKAYVNGSPVTLKSLQSLGQRLVDIHGQHAHHSLLQRNHQIALLDSYANHHAQLNKLADTYTAWEKTQIEWRELQEASSERIHRLDLLRFQIDELTQLKLSPGELEELDRELQRLSNAGQLTESSYRVLTLLYDDDNSAQARLNHALTEIEALCSLDSQLDSCREMIENATIQIQEASTELRQYSDAIELDPQRLQQVEQRISEIHDLARKYRCRPEELTEQLVQRQEELKQLEQADIQLDALEQQCNELTERYQAQANKLDSSRRKAAKKLQQQVTEAISTLGMPDGEFKIEIEKLPLEKAGKSGLNRVEFLVSANPGHAPQPLSKVASGGELSRISLAIQVAAIECAQVPTLIFDEVDVGIGGGVAEIVGRLLRRLGENRQVLCVTHLPQVASQGHQHLQVKKEKDNKLGTRTQITTLNEDQRIEEVARMLGGVEITPQTLAHAREMIDLSQTLLETT
ncbi:MAG: DNA repair protein RecN [Chromatiales bacterium]|nr:DNA repair protein RecN [Chromatiales bacterium]